MERDEKLNVWIRGNEDNSYGVMRALENLGAKDFGGEGGNSKRIYFINDVGYIDSYNISSLEAHCIINTFKEIQPVVELKDKQLIWAWDDVNFAGRNIRFYDAKNNCIFWLNGQRNGCEYDHYEPFEGEYPEWAKEAVKRLED